MEIEHLYLFTALIQLISAVNFANIAFDFHTKVFKLFFNVEDIIDHKFHRIKNAIIADQESLQQMTPLETTDGRTNLNSIEHLKKKYTKFSEQWEFEIDEVKDSVKGIETKQWFRSFFMLVSLYCIFDLALISILSIPNVSYSWAVVLFALNLGTTIFSLIIILKALLQKENIGGHQLARFTLKYFTIIVLISVLIGGINEICISNQMFIITPKWVEQTFLYLSIIIPFLPCVICSVYTLYQTQKLENRVSDAVSSLQGKQDDLHKEKIELDNAYRLFESNTTNDNISFS